jgi:hypothetical protein
VYSQALVEARQDPYEWPNLFGSVKGLIFLGTPFQGVEGYTESLQQVQEMREKGTVELQGLGVLRPGDEFLLDLVKQFDRSRPKAPILCVYQANSPLVNVGLEVSSLLVKPNSCPGIRGR